MLLATATTTVCRMWKTPLHPENLLLLLCLRCLRAISLRQLSLLLFTQRGWTQFWFSFLHYPVVCQRSCRKPLAIAEPVFFYSRWCFYWRSTNSIKACRLFL